MENDLSHLTTIRYHVLYKHTLRWKKTVIAWLLSKVIAESIKRIASTSRFLALHNTLHADLILDKVRRNMKCIDYDSAHRRHSCAHILLVIRTVRTINFSEMKFIYIVFDDADAEGDAIVGTVLLYKIQKFISKIGIGCHVVPSPH